MIRWWRGLAEWERGFLMIYVGGSALGLVGLWALLWWMSR